MNCSFYDIFREIAPPDSQDRLLYAVKPIQEFNNCFVGKDSGSHACILITTADSKRVLRSPIKFESLDAQFALRCKLGEDGELEHEETFTVIRCRLLEPEIVCYFLSACQIILRMVGDRPTQSAVALAIQRLAEIFQEIKKPPTRSINGLFGELYLISCSNNPARALAAWHIDEHARFDFSDGDVRMEVKVTKGSARIHTFSYNQCNSPLGTIAVVASLFVERVPNDLTIQSLIRKIEERVNADAELILKLHKVTATTMGSDLNVALSVSFDAKLAETSLRFFLLDHIPAIRGPLSSGVSDVHFRSDLSAVEAQTTQCLVDQDSAFLDLLPREVAT